MLIAEEGKGMIRSYNGTMMLMVRNNESSLNESNHDDEMLLTRTEDAGLLDFHLGPDAPST